MDKVRIGIVGAGNNTRRRHIPGFRALEGVEVVGVVNRTRESGERVARELGIPKVYDRWEQLLDDRAIHAVCIGTWPYMHRAVTVAALERGKHVLCEARMAMNAAESREMLAAARAKPRLVAQLVPAPHTLAVDGTLASLVAEGYVGDVLAVDLQAAQGQFVDQNAPMHWRQDAELSGNNVLNMGIWYEAMMRWLGPASSVTALTKTAVPERAVATGGRKPVMVPDHVDVLATLARSGGVAHLRFSAITALGPANEVWIFGSDGTLRLEADTLRLTGGRRGDRGLRELPVAKQPGWRVEEEFVNAVRGKERVARTTFEDGVRYMEFTDAVAASAATGQRVRVAEL
jgi:predicted dehydrogenase